MKSFDNSISTRSKSRAELLSKLLNLVSHPALAGYMPAGPASLATGQSAAAHRGGTLVRIHAQARDPYQPGCESLA